MAERVLVTGASGMVGQDLIPALLKQHPDTTVTITDVAAPSIPNAAAQFKDRITSVGTDLTDPSACAKLLDRPEPFNVCYFLHGIMSAGSEENLDLGLKVNIDSHRTLLDILRRQRSEKDPSPAVKVIFPSSLAAYGVAQPAGQLITETTVLQPQSSYGAEKAVIELLVNDFSRRGLINGRVCRLPTVIVRPGKPSQAASSFMSGVVREPLQGKGSVLPVSPELTVWVCSPPVVTANLLVLKDVPKEKFGMTRTVNLPGQTVSMQQILDALEEVGGKEARALVEEKPDRKIQDMVRTWPDRFDISLALSLGMHEDVSLKTLVQAFADSLKG